MARMTFLLTTQYSGNKGDRAVLYAMCRMLKRNWPDSEIIVSTSDASLWKGYEYYRQEKIEFVPWGWDYDNVLSKNPWWIFLRKFKKYTFTLLREGFLHGMSLGRFLGNPQFTKAVRKADKIIVVGGHHFTTILSRDLVSPVNFDAMLVAHKKFGVICFSQSFGPFEFHNPHNMRATKKILQNCILMPREKTSESELIDFLGNNMVMKPTYESVLSLSSSIKYKPIHERDKDVGIAIYCTQHRDDKKKAEYQQMIADFCNHVIKNGYEVRFFPMEIKNSIPDDRPYINEIIAKTSSPERCMFFDKDMETAEHLDEVSKCSVFLGHKTHSTIFALTTGTPLIALAYHPKTIGFMRQFGLEENAIDDKIADSNKLCDIFDRVSRNAEELSRNQYEKSRCLSQEIEYGFVEAIKQSTSEK